MLGKYLLILIDKPLAYIFGGNNRFATASFLSLIKDGNDNSFLQIHLHNTNAFLKI